jgi:MFS transporter, DHA3 family, macrolide efflux protein
MIYGGLVATGMFLLIMVLFPTLPLVLSLMVVAGPFLMAWIISTQTLLQQGTEGGFRGRVFGAYSTVSTVLMFVAAGLAGSLADALGVDVLLIAAGAIYVAAGLMAWALLRRPLRDVGRGCRPVPSEG